MTGSRAWNFSAGPAALPLPVLESVRADLLDYHGLGLSVLEMSHRSDAFAAIAARAERDLRQLLDVPDDYAVLFVQGGATLQFTMTVLNLAGEHGTVAIADTGLWSGKAFAAAERLTPTVRACSLARDANARIVIPHPRTWHVPADAAYLHVCDNETVDGIALGEQTLGGIETHFPGVPIVADLSSSLLSRPIDVSRYAVIYAGAQKNIGPAGLTLVIASPDAIARSRQAADLPNVLSYAAMHDAGSMLNTPPTFAWYVAGLVFRWLLGNGGLQEMGVRNAAQAERVYAAIDALDGFENVVGSAHRSMMNVPFSLRDAGATTAFLAAAEASGLVGLKGHKSVGGCRASLYNALPDEAVTALLALMSSHADGTLDA